jgi:hypothetical protein
MKGEERWLWTDSDSIHPYYKDCEEGSKSRMFTEGSITDSSWNISLAVTMSALVFDYYQAYLGKNLSDPNEQLFINATNHQRLAIQAFQQEHFEGYRCHVSQAYTNYTSIEIE